MSHHTLPRRTVRKLRKRIDTLIRADDRRSRRYIRRRADAARLKAVE